MNENDENDENDVNEVISLLRAGDIAKAEEMLVESRKKSAQQRLYDEIHRYFNEGVLNSVSRPERIIIAYEKAGPKRVLAFTVYRGVEYERLLRIKGGHIVGQ